jgi:catechol 2,3-dioxygenase-like lactoylglutathione lyase family enzyme
MANETAVELFPRPRVFTLFDRLKVVKMTLNDCQVFYSFSVDDIEAAKDFYGKTLGLHVKQIPEGLELHLSQETMPVFIYPSDDYHAPEHTELNFIVGDIATAVAELSLLGIAFEKYDEPGIKTDNLGIMRRKTGEMGPAAIAWFKDPAGHVLAILEK